MLKWQNNITWHNQTLSHSSISSIEFAFHPHISITFSKIFKLSSSFFASNTGILPSPSIFLQFFSQGLAQGNYYGALWQLNTSKETTASGYNLWGSALGRPFHTFSGTCFGGATHLAHSRVGLPASDFKEAAARTISRRGRIRRGDDKATTNAHGARWLRALETFPCCDRCCLFFSVKLGGYVSDSAPQCGAHLEACTELGVSWACGATSR